MNLQGDMTAQVRGLTPHETLVQILLTEGVLRTARMESAITSVERETFVDREYSTAGNCHLNPVGLDAAADASRIYATNPIVTFAAGDEVLSVSDPLSTIATLEKLNVEEGMRVLEIGCGTGYATALLQELVGSSGEIVCVDIEPELAKRCKNNLRVLGHNPLGVFQADGRELDFGIFDRIVVWPSSDLVLPSWLVAMSRACRIVMRVSIYGMQFEFQVERSDKELGAEEWHGRIVDLCFSPMPRLRSFPSSESTGKPRAGQVEGQGGKSLYGRREDTPWESMTPRELLDFWLFVLVHGFRISIERVPNVFGMCLSLSCRDGSWVVVSPDVMMVSPADNARRIIGKLFERWKAWGCPRVADYQLDMRLPSENGLKTSVFGTRTPWCLGRASVLAGVAYSLRLPGT